MKNNDYHKEAQVTSSPEKAFDAITKRINEWWSENYQGLARSTGDEFTVRFGATFKTIRITHVVENRQVTWLCVDQLIETPPGIMPLENKKEWVGNNIIWEIEPVRDGSVIKHTHVDLNPEAECWGICETGWDQTLKSLVSLLNIGKGMPFIQLDDEHLQRALEHQEKKRDGPSIISRD